MKVSEIRGQNLYRFNTIEKKATREVGFESPTYAQVPIGFKYGANITFGEFFDPNRTVPHIDYEEYMAMNIHTKRRLRKRYDNFNCIHKHVY